TWALDPTPASSSPDNQNSSRPAPETTIAGPYFLSGRTLIAGDSPMRPVTVGRADLLAPGASLRAHLGRGSRSTLAERGARGASCQGMMREWAGDITLDCRGLRLLRRSERRPGARRTRAAGCSGRGLGQQSVWAARVTRPLHCCAWQLQVSWSKALNLLTSRL